jgi:hypothetical protein
MAEMSLGTMHAHSTTLLHNATDPYSNIHFLKAYKVYTDGMHNSPLTTRINVAILS